MNLDVLLNFHPTVGWKPAAKRFIWSLIRTAIAAVVTTIIVTLDSVNPVELFQPEFAGIGATVFALVRAVLSYLATWATTTK